LENKRNVKLFIEDKDLVTEYPGDGISRQIVSCDEHRMLVKVMFEKGAIGAVHQHTHTQIPYVAEGVFEVQIKDKKSILGMGSSFHVLLNTPHGVCCSKAGILLDRFSLMRTDFIVP
jgi:quercetin dioxygenase-like cupin family protein